MNKNREENITEGSLMPYLPELNDACLGNIAAFMDLNESALVSKDFLQVSGETALRLLGAKMSNHQTGNDFLERLVTAVSTSLQRYFANNHMPPPPTARLPHNRLLLRRVNTIPMSMRLTRNIGPSATLSNGNIVTVCSEPDNLIRILDVQQMEILATLDLGLVLPVIQGAPIQQLVGPVDWITDHLFYSNGYLVLHRTAYIGAHTEWIHVWTLEEDESIVQFLYSKACSTSDAAKALQDVAVADDSTMYLLWREKQGSRDVSYKIESIQVETGELLLDTTIHMPINTDLATLPRYTISKLIVAGNYLLMLRHIEERGPFTGIGLGAYSFSRFDLSQSDFLPCFQDFEVHINHDKSGRTSQSIFLSEFTDDARVNKKISINGTSGTLVLEDGIAFGNRSEVVLATPTSVFTHHPDEEFLGLDEYDLQSGEKLRSLEMGVRSRGQGPRMVVSVLATREQGKVFISISGGFRANHIIQSFLL